MQDYLLPAAWLWLLSLWPDMGQPRAEEQHLTDGLFFGAPQVYLLVAAGLLLAGQAGADIEK